MHQKRRLYAINVKMQKYKIYRFGGLALFSKHLSQQFGFFTIP